jgi:hypothetical protein
MDTVTIPPISQGNRSIDHFLRCGLRPQSQNRNARCDRVEVCVYISGSVHTILRTKSAMNIE